MALVAGVMLVNGRLVILLVRPHSALVLWTAVDSDGASLGPEAAAPFGSHVDSPLDRE